MSQAELARLMGVARMTVNQWVHDVSEPGGESLMKLAALLFEGDILYMLFGPKREPAGGFPTLPGPPPASDSSGRFLSPFRKRKT